MTLLREDSIQSMSLPRTKKPRSPCLTRNISMEARSLFRPLRQDNNSARLSPASARAEKAKSGGGSAPASRAIARRLLDDGGDCFCSNSGLSQESVRERAERVLNKENISDSRARALE